MKDQNKLVPIGYADGYENDDLEVIETDIIEPEADPEEVNKKKSRPMSWEAHFRKHFGIPMFPLDAAKLAYLAQWIDVAGLRQQGVFYTVYLQKECNLLLPRPVYGFEDCMFTYLLDAWNCNSMRFRCRAIGEVLGWYETLRKNNADHQI